MDAHKVQHVQIVSFFSVYPFLYIRHVDPTLVVFSLTHRQLKFAAGGGQWPAVEWLQLESSWSLHAESQHTLQALSSKGVHWPVYFGDQLVDGAPPEVRYGFTFVEVLGRLSYWWAGAQRRRMASSIAARGVWQGSVESDAGGKAVGTTLWVTGGLCAAAAVWVACVAVARQMH